jgi:DNA-binding MarR family transcriptional regulator
MTSFVRPRRSEAVAQVPSPETVTELVTRAEAAGLIEREQSPDDARVFWLGLTGEAEERLARAVARNGREGHRLIQMTSGVAA